ncbi:MAG TPA: GNAT family N-acetyltransferase [Gammaproteobacteria bacterium]
MGSDYAVRVATLEDAEAVGALLRASYPRLMARSYDEALLAPALELMTKANPSLLGSGTYYLAELSTGLVVGCGGWTVERPGTGAVEPGAGHLRHFAVHPDWTRRGIGRAIFAVCERDARVAGVTTFECYSSLNAEKFYRALGFERIREMDIELRPPVALPGVLMRRDLSRRSL